ncbi:MAG: hypothetical protein J6J23_02335, partial [Clostridia bacterium]|nr:hypothetical protein [Clostridia bacterium]
SLAGNQTPKVRYTKTSERKEQETTADAIKSQADDYFNNLIESENEREPNQAEDLGLTHTTRKVETSTSGNLSHMPHIEDKYKGNQIYSDPKTLEQLFINLDGISKSHEGKTDKDYYEDLLPEVKQSLGLEKLEPIEIDEDKVKSQVEAILKGEYDLKKKSTENSFDRDIQDERQRQIDLINTAEANKEQISEIYDEAKIQASNTSLKRGLARSSIAVLSINGLEKQKAHELTTLATKLTDELNACESQIRSLRSELQQALESLDIEYAIEVDTEIKKEINNLYEKQKEVISFNNNIDKLEADYQSKRNSMLEERAKMEEKLAKEYDGIAEREKNEDMREAVLKYFETMSKAEAIKQLTSDNRFIDYLGASFYDVYYKIMRRAN